MKALLPLRSENPWAIVALALLLAPCGWSQTAAGSPQSKEAVAVVKGQAIYEDDLVPLMQSQLRQIRNQEYELKRQALENLINQKVVAEEAGKQGVGAQDLLQREVDSKVSDPSDGEVLAFYLGQKDRLNRPLDEVRDQLRQALKQAKLQQAREAFFERLREAAGVTVFLRPPRLEVSYDAARIRGDARAPVTIVEFSDFQCPFCERAYPTIKELLTKYQGRIKVAYRDFPLRNIHAQAQEAAEASRCAGEQGAFWQYHDRLFENQSKLDKAGLAAHAANLKLDPQKFEACLAGGKFRTSIEQDLQDGIQAGVTGTPAFFINGVLVSGAQPASVFEKVIEDELGVLGGKRPAQGTVP